MDGFYSGGFDGIDSDDVGSGFDTSDVSIDNSTDLGDIFDGGSDVASLDTDADVSVDFDDAGTETLFSLDDFTAESFDDISVSDVDSVPDEIVTPSLEDRTIHELETLRDSLGLGDGDSDVEQLAGRYKDIKGIEISGEVGEAHHIIPQSIVDQNKEIETAILLEKQDHRELPTTGGIINRTYEPFLPDSPENMRHRDEIKALIDDGQYAEAFRNEVLEIQKNAYDKGEEGKYDAAIRQAIDTEIDYIKEYGVPKTK